MAACEVAEKSLGVVDTAVAFVSASLGIRQQARGCYMYGGILMMVPGDAEIPQPVDPRTDEVTNICIPYVTFYKVPKGSADTELERLWMAFLPKTSAL